MGKAEPARGAKAQRKDRPSETNPRVRKLKKYWWDKVRKEYNLITFIKIHYYDKRRN